MFSLFKGKEQKSLLKEEAVAVMQQARGVAQRAVEHTGALGALFSEEVKEYAAHQVQRLIMAVLGGVLLLGAYFVLCALLAVLLAMYIGLAWALVVVFLLNLLVGIWLLMAVKRMAGKKLAPATAQELRNDWQCLKLLCKENSKP
ncbi:MAG: phage holin family protein [Akkermansia sp.]|nr:phage holin family protein [Akkermansia sp.]MBQ8375655.1 phage holin family protein [Akkermansia sp.]